MYVYRFAVNEYVFGYLANMQDILAIYCSSITNIAGVPAGGGDFDLDGEGRVHYEIHGKHERGGGGILGVMGFVCLVFFVVECLRKREDQKLHLS